MIAVLISVIVCGLALIGLTRIWLSYTLCNGEKLVFTIIIACTLLLLRIWSQ